MRRRLLIATGVLVAAVGGLFFVSLSKGVPVLTPSARLPERITYADRTYERASGCAVPDPSAERATKLFVLIGDDLPVLRDTHGTDLPTQLVVRRPSGCEVPYALLGGP